MADFEKQLTALESVVERLEQGDLSLEESVQLFEEGILRARNLSRATLLTVDLFRGAPRSMSKEFDPLDNLFELFACVDWLLGFAIGGRHLVEESDRPD